MKTIKLEGLDMALYKETLTNGLEVYLLPYDNKKDYYITYSTRFGSEVVSFTDSNKKEYKMPLGIAHFLEHKMFEQADGIDPFTFFSKSGTDSNASTSYDNTSYICTGTKNFENNLRYLIQFVNSPYFTEENVNKEKGIIAEEIKMYQDLPDFKLEMKLRENIYHKNTRRNDIAGTINDINKITKDDLYTCYNNFYTPNNMFIIITGNFDKEVALEIIKEELSKKDNNELPKIKDIKEETKVKKKQETIEATIEVPKIGVGLKVPITNLKLQDIELDLYLEAITSILFGPSSEFRERTRTEKLLDSIYTEWESTNNYKTFYLLASTMKPEELLNEIEYELNNHAISERSLNRLKKVWIANEVRMIDNIYTTIYNLFNDIINYHNEIPNKIEIIKKMNITKLQNLLKKIDFTNISIIKMIPKA